MTRCSFWAACSLSIFWTVLCSGCGGVPQHSQMAVAVELPSSAPQASYHHYLVLTHHRQAMQSPSDIEDMWAAARGDQPQFEFIRPFIQRALLPSDYTIDIELDFATLPHPLIPDGLLPRVLKSMPADVRRRADTAPMAVSVQSNTPVIRDGVHVRLVGAVVLRIAEKYNGVIIDLMTDRAFTPSQWRTLISAQHIQRSQLRFGKRVVSDRTVQLFSRGTPKFGVPDLMVTHIPDGQLKAGSDFFRAVHQALLRGQRVKNDTFTWGAQMWPVQPCPGRVQQCITISYDAQRR